MYRYYKWWGDSKVRGDLFCFVFLLLLFVLSWLIHDSCCVSFLVCFLLCLWSFNQALLVCKNHCFCFVKLFQKSGFWPLLCGFPWKRESALISITLQGVNPVLYITFRLLCQIYNFSLLICYPSSFLFCASMLITLLEWKLLLMTLEKTRN